MPGPASRGCSRAGTLDLVIVDVASSAPALRANARRRAEPRRGGRSRQRQRAPMRNRGSAVRASWSRPRIRHCGVQRRDTHQETESARPDIASERAFESYSYDLNGNRVSSLNSSGVFSATFDAQDRILTYGNLSFRYTPNGELASTSDTATNAVTQYTYDALGNLRSVALPNGDVIEYLVDGLGRRVGKKVNGVLVKQWLWRGRLQPVAELDGSGNLVAQFVYLKRNVPSLIVTSGATYRLVKDERGSVRQVVDTATGAIEQEIVYDTWGRVISDTNPGFQPFGFAGGLYEPETSLVRFGKRDYDAEIGRWTSKDPLGLDGGLNTFVYVENDPINAIDVTGEGPVGDTVAGAIDAIFGAYDSWGGDATSGEGGYGGHGGDASVSGGIVSSGNAMQSASNAYFSLMLGPLALGGCGDEPGLPPFLGAPPGGAAGGTNAVRSNGISRGLSGQGP